MRNKKNGLGAELRERRMSDRRELSEAGLRLVTGGEIDPGPGDPGGDAIAPDVWIPDLLANGTSSSPTRGN